jgi:diguanylate cyclase (GGDEF)-like protein
MKKILLHAFLGGLVGYFILHPVTMLIYHQLGLKTITFISILSLTFSRAHLHMAFFFTLLGGALGLIQGIYIYRITSLYDRVKALSITDDLTSLFNRRYFFDKLEEEAERARRYSRQLYLLLIDIDDFKRINDTFGHQQGDQVLKTFAQRLKNSVRMPDLVARYGGEEFVILMPETNEAAAKRLAHRLCAEIASYQFVDGAHGDGNHLTISVGLAGFPTNADTPSALLKKADAAMYQAKANGKNQIFYVNTNSPEHVSSCR